MVIDNLIVQEYWPQSGCRLFDLLYRRSLPSYLVKIWNAYSTNYLHCRAKRG
jgi:hypothetical protein